MDSSAGDRAVRPMGARVGGLVLAAGEGRRMGGPKALLRLTSAGQTMVEHAISVVSQGGCRPVTVVVGAAADRVRPLVEALGAVAVDEPEWAEGMGASLRAGLRAVAGTGVDAVLVTLVDLPDVGPDVMARMVGSAEAAATATLSRAAYLGVAGHPVLIGREHWAGVTDVARGDRGARDYLASHPAALVECGDLASGVDLDRPADVWAAPAASADGTAP